VLIHQEWKQTAMIQIIIMIIIIVRVAVSMKVVLTESAGPVLPFECYISLYLIQWHNDTLNYLGQGIEYLQIMKQLQVKYYVIIYNILISIINRFILRNCIIFIVKFQWHKDGNCSSNIWWFFFSSSSSSPLSYTKFTN
jgi:hypothetical protein